jgi:hypothetical protein
VELCFQTAGLWEICEMERFGLPATVGRVRFPAAPPASEGPIRAVVHPAPSGEWFDAEVLDAAGNVLVGLESYRTIELPGGLDAAAVTDLRMSLT